MSSSRAKGLKDEKVDLVADSHSILAGWRNHFFQLFNIHVWQTEIHTAEPLVPEPSTFVETEFAIEKLKNIKSQQN